MKKRYEYLCKDYVESTFFEIEIKDCDLIIYEGKLLDYYGIEHAKTKKIESCSTTEEAQIVFDKYCKEYEAKGYDLQDYPYPSKQKNLSEYDRKYVSDSSYSFSENKDLRFLELRTDQLSENIGEYKNLKHLILKGDFRELPESICECQDLEVLEITGWLQKLPENIGKLKKLKVLDCSYTELTRFPNSLVDCTNLEHINIGSCDFKSFLLDWHKLEKLNYFYIRYCKLQQFPIEITTIPNLETLIIAYNEFSIIPPEIGNLKKLKDLDLSINRGITMLPKELAELSNLESLDLYATKVEGIPKDFVKLEKINHINLEETPFYKQTKINKLNRDSLLKYLGEENSKKQTKGGFKNNPEKYIENLKSNSQSGKQAIEKLIKNDLKTVEPYLEKINLDINSIHLLCGIDSEKYEPFLLKSVQYATTSNEKAQLSLDLYRFYGEKHKELILELIKQYIEEIKVFKKDKKQKFRISETEKFNNIAYLKWIEQHFPKAFKELVFDKAIQQETDEFDAHFLHFFLELYEKETIQFLVKALGYKSVYKHYELEDYNHKKFVSLIFSVLNSYDYTKYHEKVWDLLGHAERDIRVIAAKELKRLYDDSYLIKKAKKLLVDGTKNKRDGINRLLMTLEDASILKIIKKILSNEQDSTNRLVLVDYLIEVGEKEFVKKEIFKSFKKAKENKLLSYSLKKWLDETTLPTLYWKNRKKIDPLFFKFLYKKQQAKEKPVYELTEEAKIILNEIDKTKSGDFAYTLLEMIEENGGIKAVNKTLLPIVVALGDERVVESLKKYCIAKKNVLSANLLRNNISSEAARALNGIMLHFKVKYPNVRDAAEESFDLIAKNMGVSRMELMDKMIPDFGFINLFKTFEIDAKEWKAFIGSNLKLQYLTEDDKIKKTISSKASKELKNELKVLKKNIRSLVTEQKKSLLHYFINGRKWTTDDWMAHFMSKPLMFAFAQTLIWGIYKEGKLIETFGVNQDQTLENVDLEEIELPENSNIGIVHPIELTEAVTEAWQQYLKYNNSTPPFLQMDRPVFAQKDLKALDLKGKVVSNAFFRTLTNRGWRRGQVVDTGYIISFYKPYQDKNASLDVRDLHVDWITDEITIQELYLPDEQKESVLYSETVWNLHDALASVNKEKG